MNDYQKQIYDKLYRTICKSTECRNKIIIDSKEALLSKFVHSSDFFTVDEIYYSIRTWKYILYTYI